MYLKIYSNKHVCSIYCICIRHSCDKTDRTILMNPDPKSAIYVYILISHPILPNIGKAPHPLRRGVLWSIARLHQSHQDQRWIWRLIDTFSRQESGEVAAQAAPRIFEKTSHPCFSKWSFKDYLCNETKVRISLSLPKWKETKTTQDTRSFNSFTSQKVFKKKLWHHFLVLISPLGISSSLVISKIQKPPAGDGRTVASISTRNMTWNGCCLWQDPIGHMTLGRFD